MKKGVLRKTWGSITSQNIAASDETLGPSLRERAFNLQFSSIQTNKAFLTRGIDSSRNSCYLDNWRGENHFQLNGPVTTKCPSTYLSQLATCNHHRDQTHLKGLARRSRPCMYQGYLNIQTSIFSDYKSSSKDTSICVPFRTVKTARCGEEKPASKGARFEILRSHQWDSPWLRHHPLRRRLRPHRPSANAVQTYPPSLSGGGARSRTLPVPQELEQARLPYLRLLASLHQ